MWDIKPLNVGTLFLTKVGKRCVERTPISDAGVISGIPCIVWLLTNQQNGKKMLVDAGPSVDPERDSILHGKIERKPEQQLKYVLAQQDTELSEIDTVILTHLHWDHMLGVLELPWAKVIVQKKELTYAVAPLALEYASYELNDPSQPPPFLRFLSQIEVVDGDCQFEKDIRLIPLPGHTPGSQGVYIQSSIGKVLLTGDLFDSYENLRRKTPTCLYSSLEEFHSSLDKVLQLEKIEQAIIFPGHDYEVWKELQRRERL